MPVNENISTNVYKPRQINRISEDNLISKVNTPIIKSFLLSILAGVFISFAGAFYTISLCGSNLGFGVTKIIGGMSFSVGLVLVLIAGSELFTGNTLLLVPLFNRKITILQLLKNWMIVYLGNFAGSLLMVLLITQAHILEQDHGQVGNIAEKIALSKVSLGFTTALIKGIMCNFLVCLAIWMSYAGKSVSDKILAIVFPITCFVALGFEHSVANMYLIPVAMFNGADISIFDFLHNMIPVTIGNIIGGGCLVGLVYNVIYKEK